MSEKAGQAFATTHHFNADCECFAVLMLNVKRRIRGHPIVSIGSPNKAMAHPCEVFRAAVIGATHGVVIMYNHPRGSREPSEADRPMSKWPVKSI